MKLIALGTGNAIVTECYNTCFAIEKDNEYLLVDGGGGNTIIHQLREAKIELSSIRHVFVTHKHIDHLLGIIWIIRMLGKTVGKPDYTGNVYIYSHSEVIDLLKQLTSTLLHSKETKYVGQKIHFVTLNDGDEFSALGNRFKAFDIQSTKADQFGFTMYYGLNKKLTCCGDEPYADVNFEYADQSDWLLHEAFCLYSEADKFHPYEKHHSTVKEACENAEKLGIKNLVLYHTEDKNIKNRKELYSKEGRQYYSGNLLIPDDLEVIELD